MGEHIWSPLTESGLAMARRLGFFLAIFAFELATASEGSVDIINETSSRLLVRCKSGNDDLGNVYLLQNGDYYFHFGQNIFGTTFFYCQFNWGGFSKVVPVWRGKAYVDRLDCEVEGQCVWKVTAAGFFWATKGPLQPFNFYGDWVRAPPHRI